MKINDGKLVERWNRVFYDIGLEHFTIDTDLSELEAMKNSYDVEDGISLNWMLHNAKEELSCYYESGHCRCDDRFEDKEYYKIWVSETAKLKRLIARLENFKNEVGGKFMVVEWL